MFIRVLENFPIDSSILILTSWNILSQLNADDMQIINVLALT